MLERRREAAVLVISQTKNLQRITAGAHLGQQTFLESLETGGHGDDLDDFDPGNNPDFESDWQEAEGGLSGHDDDF